MKGLAKSEVYRNYKKIWPYVKPYRFRALLSTLLSIPIGALDASIGYLLKPFMDTVLIEKTINASFIPILIISITFLQSILLYTSNYFNTWVGQKINYDIKLKLFKKLLTKKSSFFDTVSSGHILFNYNSLVNSACSNLLTHLKTFTTKLSTSFFLILVLLYNSIELSVIALLALFLAFYPIKRARKKIAELTSQSFGVGAKVPTHFNELYNGNKIIKAYNLDNKVIEQYDYTLKQAFVLAVRMVKRTGMISPVVHIMTSIGISGVIWYGGYLIMNGHMTPGNFVSFIVSLIMLYTPFKQIGNLYGQIIQSMMAMNGMFKLLEEPIEFHDKDNAKSLESIHKNIVFKDLNFAYQVDTPVLQNINLTINMGETIAIVGNSGGGKTTLCNLLLRFYIPNSGQILIDDVDIQDIKLYDLWHNISTVFQHNFLFDDSIKNNILAGNPNAKEEEIQQAAKMACVDDFANTLEKGLDTRIGEMGSLLSGGQKQRIAIARAFIKKSSVILLDEATSSLDNHSEKMIQSAINNLMKNRTMVIIAHRLSTIRNADKIVVMNEGHIVEVGTHDELIKNEEGVYNALYKTQFS